MKTVSKNKKTKEIEKIETENPEKNKKEMIRSLIHIVIALLLVSSVLINFMQYKRSKDKTPSSCSCKCDMPSRSINIDGYDFVIDGTWNLNIETNKVIFSNSDETVSLSFNLNNTSYSKLTEDDNMKKYIETLQTKDNAFINTISEYEKDGIKYYYLEGVKDSFPYINILTAKDDNTFIVTGVFENAKTLETHKDNIIDMTIKSSKNK